MKSLLITNTFLPRIGGREYYLHNIFSRLYPQDLVVLTPDHEGDCEAFDQASSFRIIRVPPERFHWFFKGGRRRRLSFFTYLAFLCRRENVRIVHCGVTLPDAVTGLLLQETLGLPYVVYTFGLEITHPILKPWTQERVVNALKGADRVVSISDATGRRVVELGVDPHRVVTVYPGVDTELFHPDPEASAVVRRRFGLEGKKVVATVGRLVPRKGQDQVIKALPAVAEAVPEVIYLLAGDGPDRGRLEALVRDVGVSDRVLFTGSVPYSETPAYYNAADVMAMVSREEVDKGDVEGFGLVFLEANACGKPTIGGRSGGVVEAIVDGETGFLVDPHDPQAIADRIVRLLTAPDLARRMSERGQERARQEFTWERALRRVQQIEKEVMSASTRLAPPGRMFRSARFLLHPYPY